MSSRTTTAGLGITTTNALSTNNPANWIWFGSNGLLSAYSYLSNPSLFGTQFTSAEVQPGRDQAHLAHHRRQRHAARCTPPTRPSAP